MITKINEFRKLHENYISDHLDFESVEKFNIFVESICKSMNIEYNYIKILAEGGNGIAIDLGDSILKLTHDKSEAYFAYKLKNIDSKNLVKIYDITYKEDIDMFVIHQEKLITKLNNSINLFVDYLHKQNPITNRINIVSDDEVYDYFKNKLISLSRENILLLFEKWKSVYDECKKYDISLSDFHGKNVGIRQSNPTDLVYFDISDPYETYNNKLKINNI